MPFTIFESSPGVQKFFHPAIPDGMDMENKENTEQNTEHKDGKHQSNDSYSIYDSEHPIYDTKHSICDSNTPFYSIYGDGLKNNNIRARRT